MRICKKPVLDFAGFCGLLKTGMQKLWHRGRVGLVARRTLPATCASEKGGGTVSATAQEMKTRVYWALKPV